MSDLVEFLRARLDEDERAALEARGKRWHIGNAIDPTKPCNVHEFPTVRLIADNCGWLEAEHIARWNPARALAEVETKRRIIAEYEGEAKVMEMGHRSAWTEGGQAARLTALKLLALPYAEHPDYDEAWRP